jgi:putative ABC transport system substrate-binding protein
MNRREFIALLGGAATWPIAARAQQQSMPVIGFLDTAAGPVEIAFRIEAFHRGLNETGFVEGQNVAIEFRWTEGKLDRAPSLAADLVRRRVAVIVTQNLTTPAAKAATSTIPIVFVIGGDPVASGLVTSVSRPEGNVTGVSWTGGPLLIAKRLELLHELVPKPALIGVLLTPSSPSFEFEL